MKKPIQKQLQCLSAITFAALLTTAGPLYAAGDHAHGHDDDHGDSHGSEMKHDDHSHGTSMDDHHDSAMDKVFLKKKEIGGYNVSFHIMKAKPGKEMGGTHDFMIKVEKDGKALTNIVMNTKVKHPDGSSETKKTMQMGDWMMAGYDLGHEGKHQMMVLFKTADGKKHKGGIYYSGR
ncbi:hypothetical protein MNBD_GAMMA17-639 [hydrothermal vent metagenome]|uniref:YtkA-like domain-containing protein n=1 Tax=hydrothermal vent metagenome TaxID=652676 RepID=A0A3B0Z7V1_9ZZZZ